jgi:hypothetical protein
VKGASPLLHLILSWNQCYKYSKRPKLRLLQNKSQHVPAHCMVPWYLDRGVDYGYNFCTTLPTGGHPYKNLNLVASASSTVVDQLTRGTKFVGSDPGTGDKGEEIMKKN